jgi:hypothetical protein
MVRIELNDLEKKGNRNENWEDELDPPKDLITSYCSGHGYDVDVRTFSGKADWVLVG